MTTQRDIWADGESSQWLERNRGKLPVADDPVLEYLAQKERTPPECCLEVGCSNGWRLNEINRKYGTECSGIDVGWAAIQEGKERYPHLDIKYGSADRLSYMAGLFDLVIYGFCLYQVDRRDLFLVAAEGDRVLKNGGRLLIYDFPASHAHSTRYHHNSSLLTYKMSYAGLWLANPAYSNEYTRISNTDWGLWVLRKNLNAGWPLEE